MTFLVLRKLILKQIKNILGRSIVVQNKNVCTHFESKSIQQSLCGIKLRKFKKFCIDHGEVYEY